MKYLFAAIVLVLTVTAAAAEECSCVRISKETQCSNACTPRNVIDALKKRYPDMQDDDEVQMFPDGEVIFYTPKAHMSCRVNLGPPIRISRCRQIHA